MMFFMLQCKEIGENGVISVGVVLHVVWECKHVKDSVTTQKRFMGSLIWFVCYQTRKEREEKLINKWEDVGESHAQVKIPLQFFCTFFCSMLILESLSNQHFLEIQNECHILGANIQIFGTCSSSSATRIFIQRNP